MKFYQQKLQKDREEMDRIKAKVSAYAESKKRLDKEPDYAGAWKDVYAEYEARTGVSPYKGYNTPMQNILYRTRTLVDLEAIVDELTSRPMEV